MIGLPIIVDSQDALAQPTRARLFALLSELKRPAGTTDLAERLKLHHNGVRIHLEHLERDGLVERARAHRRRGRPIDTWTIAPGAQPRGRAPHAYRDLGRWLARALGSSRGGVRGIEATGRKLGRELAPTEAGGDLDALQATLASLGFSPAIERSDDGRFTARLGTAPTAMRCTRTSRQSADAPRITRGLLDVLEPGATLVAFEPHDPDHAGCLLEIRGADAADAARR